MSSISWPFGGLKAKIRAFIGSGTLRSRVISGGGVLILADIYSNGLRLAGNLILTRLLFPEAFGLMLIVNLVFTALEMLSDVGLRGSVILRREDPSRRFLDTIWTLAIIRGVCLGCIAFGLAEPISTHYGQEQLFGMLAIASVAPVINGLTSIRPLIHEKQVELARVVIWKGLTQSLALIVLVVWLLIDANIYALAANGVISAVIGVIGSYVFFRGHRPAIAWDKSVVWDVLNRGRWIFLATGMTYLARQGDGLILSNWVTAELLGIFSIAVGFAKLLETLFDRLSWSLLFPVYSEIRTGDIELFHTRLRKIRLILYAICTPVVLTFALFGKKLIALLYDQRFEQAGWMLEVMAAGSVFYAVGAAIICVPLSFDEPKRHMWLQLIRFLILLCAMYIGGNIAGVEGLVTGIAVAQVVFFPILCLGTHRYAVGDYWTDGLFLLAITVSIFTVWSVAGWPY